MDEDVVLEESTVEVTEQPMPKVETQAEPDYEPQVCYLYIVFGLKGWAIINNDAGYTNEPGELCSSIISSCRSESSTTNRYYADARSGHG